MPIGNIEDLGHLVVAHPLKTDEQDDLTLFVRQVGECAFEISQLEPGDSIRGRYQHTRLFELDNVPFAHSAAHVV